MYEFRFGMNYIYFFAIAILIFNSIDSSYGFAECSNSNATDPTTAGVTSCLSWAAYLQSQGSSIVAWCADPVISKKCCFTCGVIYAGFSQCLDASSDCQRVYYLNNGNCSRPFISSNNIAFYCPRTCNACNGLRGPTCSSSFCGNNAVCSSTTIFGVSTITCNCLNNYVGVSCSRLNICVTNNPCNNGGTCLISQDENIVYTCQCPSGCTGSNCELCSCSEVGIDACQNGGICLSTDSCQCANGYSGTFCQTFIGGCFSQPCQNGGTCLSNGVCQCTASYSGTYCTTFIGGCVSNPCLNSGICLSTGLCDCPIGYTGTRCETSNGDNSNTNSNNIGLIVGLTVSVVACILVIIAVIVVYRCFGDRILQKCKSRNEDPNFNSLNLIGQRTNGVPLSLSRRVGNHPAGTYVTFEDTSTGRIYNLNPPESELENVLRCESLCLTPFGTQNTFRDKSGQVFVIKPNEEDPSKGYYTIEYNN